MDTMSFTSKLRHPKIIRALSLAASLLVAGQIIYSLISGSAVCLNEGCEIVERLTVVSPIYLNVAGLIFFQLIFWSFRWFQNTPSRRDELLSFLLLSGLAAEAVLLAYQLFVAQVFCSYCLIVFACVVGLNLAAGGRRLVSGLAAAAAVVVSFSVLIFMPARVIPANYSFELGTFGVCNCEAPSKEIFLLFSSDCPHCQTVIQELENCNSCQLYLNPIDKIDSLDFPDAELRPSYSPEINRLMLALLGINEIPVLVVRNNEGYTFIKGEKNIISYVRLACFQQEPVMYLDRSESPAQDDITLFSEEDQNCSIDINCEDK